MATPQENKEILKRFISLLGTSNVDGVEALLAEDMIWVIPQRPEYSPLAGPRNKVEWDKLYRGFVESSGGSGKFSVVSMTAEDDRVAVEAVNRAETPFGLYENQYHFAFKMRDGLIVGATEYADSLAMYMMEKKMRGEA
jgi:uncharacterized protein